MRLNLLLVFMVAFLPFPTKLLAEYIHEHEAERVATTFYGLCLLTTSLILSVLIRPDVEDADVQILTERLTPGLIGYVAVIIAGLFFPIAAVIGYLAIALFYLLPFGLHKRVRH